MKFLSVLYIIMLFFAFPLGAQNTISLKGKILDTEGEPVESAHIRNMSNNTGQPQNN